MNLSGRLKEITLAGLQCWREWLGDLGGDPPQERRRWAWTREWW